MESKNRKSNFLFLYDEDTYNWWLFEGNNYEAPVFLKWGHIRTRYLLGIGTPWVLLHEYPRNTKKKKKFEHFIK